MKKFIKLVYIILPIIIFSQDSYKFNISNKNFLKQNINISINNDNILLNCSFNIIEFTVFCSNLYFLNSKDKFKYFDNDIVSNLKYLNIDSKKKLKENPFRRAEVLFFGSLTFAAFGGWLFLSLYNFLIYDEVFGRLKREQFLILYLGSSVISIGVVLSDIFLYINPKLKRVKFY